jgi:hypothetical protein
MVYSERSDQDPSIIDQNGNSGKLPYPKQDGFIIDGFSILRFI